MMTGFSEQAGIDEPMSIVTLQAFADVGFEVDLTQADAYQLPGAAATAAEEATRSRGGVRRVDDVIWGDIYGIGPDGAIKLVRKGRR